LTFPMENVYYYHCENSNVRLTYNMTVFSIHMKKKLNWNRVQSGLAQQTTRYKRVFLGMIQ
jgi:hypothetical protein